MAKQSIDFKHAGDSGEREDPDAIERYDDGEPASETVFRRPVENLRYRSELLRTEGEDDKYLQDSDMRWVISAGNDVGSASGSLMPTVTWDRTTGKFVVSDDIVVQPLSTPLGDMKETKDYVFGTAPADVRFSFTALLFAYEKANIRKIIWEAKPTGDIPGGACAAVVSGDPKHVLTITVRDDWLTQAADVQVALIAVTADLAIMGIGYSMVGTAGTLISALPTDADYIMRSTWERELHYITPAQFVDFFTSHTLVDGDTLSIWYDWMYDDVSGNNGGRKQSTTTTVDTGTGFPPNTHVTSGQMFITSDDPNKIPLSIPLCKRIGDDLLFLDGTVVKGDATHSLGYTALPFSTNGYIVDDALTSWVANGLLTANTHDGQSVSDWPIIADTLQTNLEALQVYLNDKGSLVANEVVTGTWRHTAPLDVDSTLDLNTGAAYIKGFGAAQNVPALLYRSHGVTSNAGVTTTTVSVYAMDWLPATGGTASGAYITVTGAWLEVDTTSSPGTTLLLLHVAPASTAGVQTLVQVSIVAGAQNLSEAWDTTAGSTLTVGVGSTYKFNTYLDAGVLAGKGEFTGVTFEFLDPTVVHFAREARIHEVLTLGSNSYGSGDGYINLLSSYEDSGAWKLYKKTPDVAGYPGIKWYYKDAPGIVSSPGLWSRVAINCVWSGVAPASWIQIATNVPSKVIETTALGTRTYIKDPGSVSSWLDSPNMGGSDEWDDIWESQPQTRRSVTYPEGDVLEASDAVAFPVSMVFAKYFNVTGDYLIDDTIDWRDRRILARVIVSDDTDILGQDTNAQDLLKAAYVCEKIIVTPPIEPLPTPPTVPSVFSRMYLNGGTGALSFDISQTVQLYVDPSGDLRAITTVDPIAAIMWLTPTTRGVYNG